MPSTSSRTSPGSSSVIAETVPRLSPSGIDQRERHLDHRVEVGDRDVLVGRVDLRIPLARLRQGSPFALKTFASAPPPVSVGTSS